MSCTCIGFSNTAHQNWNVLYDTGLHMSLAHDIIWIAADNMNGKDGAVIRHAARPHNVVFLGKNLARFA